MTPQRRAARDPLTELHARTIRETYDDPHAWIDGPDPSFLAAFHGATHTMPVQTATRPATLVQRMLIRVLRLLHLTGA